MSLREHLLAAQAGSQPQVQQQQQQPPQPQPPPPPPQQPQPHGLSLGPHEHSSIDPAIAQPQYGIGPGDGQYPGEVRKGKRELSTSKRAAQNRAAQRAFRQRKEEYIKSLKGENEQLKAIEQEYRQLQSEHYQLRNYVITLQSKLLESAGSFPPPPSNIDLSRIQEPHGVSAPPSAEPVQHHQQQQAQPQMQGAPTAAMSSSAVSQLQAAAAAAQATEHMNNNAKQPNAEGYAPASAEYSPPGKGENAAKQSPQNNAEPSPA